MCSMSWCIVYASCCLLQNVARSCCSVLWPLGVHTEGLVTNSMEILQCQTVTWWWWEVEVLHSIFPSWAPQHLDRNAWWAFLKMKEYDTLGNANQTHAI